jgi:hypothetical protein
MATSAERMRALRERERRGLRRFTIAVSEDDLRVIAEHGYKGAGTDPGSAGFITDMLAASIGQSNGVTTAATPFQ